jgi:hypothetical protein
MAEPTSPREHNAGAEKTFAPKHKVDLLPPKDDPITYEELAQCDGMGQRPYQAKQGTLTDRRHEPRQADPCRN